MSASQKNRCRKTYIALNRYAVGERIGTVNGFTETSRLCSTAGMIAVIPSVVCLPRTPQNVQDNGGSSMYQDPDLCTASETLIAAGMSPRSLNVSAILCCSAITSLLIGWTSKPL